MYGGRYSRNYSYKDTYTQVHYSWKAKCLLHSKLLVRAGGKGLGYPVICSPMSHCRCLLGATLSDPAWSFHKRLPTRTWEPLLRFAGVSVSTRQRPQSPASHRPTSSSPSSWYCSSTLSSCWSGFPAICGNKGEAQAPEDGHGLRTQGRGTSRPPRRACLPCISGRDI